LRLKATLVSICPTEAATQAGRPSLTPELLAASGARYSRNNEGLDAILAKIDWNNLDKSVDGIFRMIDYGHQSITDMSPVAIFIDGASQYLVYLLWAICQVVGGQESSTRFILMNREGLIDPQTLGIPEELRAEWSEYNERAFSAYHQALACWEHRLDETPQLARIPTSLLEATDDKSIAAVARMKRNYGFDRSRYFVPTGMGTNVMMIMPAREWAKLCRYLHSHMLSEAQQLGAMIMEELNLVIPRLLKHAVYDDETVDQIWDEFDEDRESLGNPSDLLEVYPTPYLDIMPARGTTEEDVVKALKHHNNRYGPFGRAIRRMSVRYGVDAVTLGEIRDFNRHRTGEKFCPQTPLGFYCALDQCQDDPETLKIITELHEVGVSSTRQAAKLLKAGDPTYAYWLLLGTQFPFEQTTTGNKAIYTWELRTGPGAHYRYADHFRCILELWYQQYPQTRGLIKEGLAEPE